MKEIQKLKTSMGQTKKKLIETEGKLPSPFRNIGIVIMYLTADFKIVDFNPEAERLYGKKREEVIGKAFLELFVPHDIHDSIRSDAAKVISGEPTTGQYRWLEDTVSPFASDSGRVISLFGVARDVTERKQIEDELIESAKKLETKAKELKESNTALKVLLKQREDDKREFEENILSNIKHLILPYIDKLKRNKVTAGEVDYLNILESNLNEIISPFSSRLSSDYLGFTPKEIQIANLIKDGKRDKDIMEILNISFDTVKTHRQNIRKKWVFMEKELI